MVKFETLTSQEMKFGNNNFIEIARKKAIADEGENLFISISRGFIKQTGEKRYRSSVSLPINEELIAFISHKLKEV